MPIPENSAAANLQLLHNYLTQHTNQQELHYQWKNSGNNHQLALCFTFPEGFTLDLKQVKQNTSYGERVMRLCESVNQPDTIKADLWTRSTNDGTLSGIRPGIPVEGEPIPPEEFLGQLNYTLISFVFPGPKHGGGKCQSVVTAYKASPEFDASAPHKFLGVPIIHDSNVPKGSAFLMNENDLAAMSKLGDAIKKAKPKPKKPSLKNPSVGADYYPIEEDDEDPA